MSEENKQYTTMAEVYDDWMRKSPPPYDAWVEFIDNEARLFGAVQSHRGSALDLGCGTGNMSLRLASMGWSVTGVDPSAGMIAVAAEKVPVGRVEFMVGALPDVAGLPTANADLAISCFDAMNYLSSVEDLAKSLARIADLLRPGGIAVFDLNTEFKLGAMWDSNHWGDDFGSFSYVWRNRYDRSTRSCAFTISFFVEETADVFRRSTEEHVQRWFSDAEVLAAARAAGLEVRRVAAAYSFSAPGPQTPRISWTVQKPGA